MQTEALYRGLHHICNLLLYVATAKIKNAKDVATKTSYRNEKASVIAYHESQIRLKQSTLTAKNNRLAQLIAQLAREK